MKVPGASFSFGVTGPPLLKSRWEEQMIRKEQTLKRFSQTQMLPEGGIMPTKAVESDFGGLFVTKI